ncbi:MAG: penicillin-binding protein activator [Proteobacteria bacterium]|nr:penicillin-binding protein activator [Pseudomonadota bacterium]
MTTGIESTAESIDDLLTAARRRSGTDAANFAIRAMEEMLLAGLTERAADEADQLNRPNTLPAELQLRFSLIRAAIALRQEQPTIALRWLTGSLASEPENQPLLQAEYYSLLGNAYRDSGRYAEAVNAYSKLADPTEQFQDQNVHDEIWNALAYLTEADINNFAVNANSYELRGWIELARVFLLDQYSIKSQSDSIAQWRRIWVLHSATNRLPSPLVNLQQVWDSRPRHIALILPLQTPAGNAIQEGFISAFYQALEISREVPRISVYDSSYVSLVYPIYDEAVASGADLIIGPLSKELVNQLRRLPVLPVPTLALNYADELPGDPGKLFQFGLAPEDEIKQVATLAWAAGHRNAAIITPQTADYPRLQSAFIEEWSARGGNIVAQATFSGDADYSDVIKGLMAIDASEARRDRLLDLLPRINMEFTPRRRSDIDFIFLSATPRQGRQIKPTLAFHFAENIPVYAMPSIYNGIDNQSENRDLDGIVFLDAPWIFNSSDPLKSEIASNLRQVQDTLLRLRAMGIDSFRLYARLGQMASRQIDSLQGATGTLTMSDNQIIHRKLEVARFIDGLAILLESAATDTGN